MTIQQIFHKLHEYVFWLKGFFYFFAEESLRKKTDFKLQNTEQENINTGLHS